MKGKQKALIALMLSVVMPASAYAGVKMQSADNTTSTNEAQTEASDTTVGKVNNIDLSFNRDTMANILTWDKVDNATEYEVYWGTYDVSKFNAMIDETWDGKSDYFEYEQEQLAKLDTKKIATVKDNKYEDKAYTPNKEGIYKVRAVVKTGDSNTTGEFSKVVDYLQRHGNSVTGKLKTADFPVTYCKTCGKDITAAKDVVSVKESGGGVYPFQGEDKTYYCSKCGIDKVASHNSSDISEHIQKEHSSDNNVSVMEYKGFRREVTSKTRRIQYYETHNHHYSIPIKEGDEIVGWHCSAKDCDASYRYDD